MEYIGIITKIAEFSLTLAVVLVFSLMGFRYFIAKEKKKDEEFNRLLKESNERYDRMEERHTLDSNEMLRQLNTKDEFLRETLVKTADAISTLAYTNAKVFKGYKNAISEISESNENVKG
jgi:hypothetical protein